MATGAHAALGTETIPIDDVTDTVPCVNESIHVTGAFHFVNSIEFLGSVLFMKSTLSAEGVSGVGLATGTQYRFVDSTNFRGKFAASAEPVVFVVSENFAAIGRGSAADASILCTDPNVSSSATSSGQRMSLQGRQCESTAFGCSRSAGIYTRSVPAAFERPLSPSLTFSAA